MLHEALNVAHNGWFVGCHGTVALRIVSKMRWSPGALALYPVAVRLGWRSSAVPCRGVQGLRVAVVGYCGGVAPAISFRPSSKVASVQALSLNLKANGLVGRCKGIEYPPFIHCDALW